MRHLQKRSMVARLLALLMVLSLLPGAAAAKTVVTSFYPIWLITIGLTQGVEDITVRNLTQPDTGCLHDYQLTSGDLKALSTADLFLVNGAGMESYLDMVFSTFSELPVVDASAGIELMVNPEGSETPYNAHVWLDPMRAAQMAENLAEGLIAAWPEDAEAIRANCEAMKEAYTALDAELREGLSSLTRRDMITFHEAFPYFAEAYNLNVAAVVTSEPDETLSPARLAELIRIVRELNNPPLFVEPQYPDLNARTVAQETGAAIWTLDPIVTGPSDVTEALDYYDATMRQNMQTLLEALE